MLIPSPRHTPHDLTLWRELEEADLLHWERLELSGRVERSLDALRAFLDVGSAYCGVSWGKDSVVVASLCRQVSLALPLVHLRPSNHNPDCDAVRDWYFSHRPGQPYSEHAINYGGLHAAGLSPTELDQQTDRLWYAGIRAAERTHGVRHILGIRAAESSVRMIRCRKWGESSVNGCAPIAWWSDADVFAYLAHHGLPVHPAYAMLGNGRWPRDRLRVAEIGDTHGRGGGRNEWEQEYYRDVLNRIHARRPDTA